MGCRGKRDLSLPGSGHDGVGSFRARGRLFPYALIGMTGDLLVVTPDNANGAFTGIPGDGNLYAERACGEAAYAVNQGMRSAGRCIRVPAPGRSDGYANGSARIPEESGMPDGRRGWSGVDGGTSGGGGDNGSGRRGEPGRGGGAGGHDGM